MRTDDRLSAIEERLDNLEAQRRCLSMRQDQLEGRVGAHRADLTDLRNILGAYRAEVQRRLLGISGVGPWTATYISLRALGDPDAFPAGDLGLRRAAERLGLPANAAGLEAHSERWRPWRAYAAHYLWAADA